jgi:hypothetical protein
MWFKILMLRLSEIDNIPDHIFQQENQGDLLLTIPFIALLLDNFRLPFPKHKSTNTVSYPFTQLTLKPSESQNTVLRGGDHE